jgi:hypothetical protein
MRTLVVASMLALTACVGSARTFGTYESKAAETAKGAIAEVETVRMVVDAMVARRTTANYSTIVISDSEDDANAIKGTFDLIQPPDARSDALRAELDKMLSDAGDVISMLRIAARRHEFGKFEGARPALADVSQRLNDFQKAHGG